jgi:hypothetical protein
MRKCKLQQKKTTTDEISTEKRQSFGMQQPGPIAVGLKNRKAEGLVQISAGVLPNLWLLHARFLSIPITGLIKFRFEY